MQAEPQRPGDRHHACRFMHWQRRNCMQVNISGHQLEVTKPLREYIELKLRKLEGHFDKITNVQVTMAVEKLKQKIEATLHIHGGEVVANAQHDDMYAAIDLLTDKLDRQLLKHKEKQQSILKGAAAR
ncbi:Ribosomal subunit interface protein [Pseudomonas coronafaciens pv. garcae]|nr:Ribosomal subunit interface protein [Pseudomonas coronafaciens pv. garcae]